MKLLSLPASPDVPVACDMSTAHDTLAERQSEYRRLFEHALLRRDSTTTAATFRLAARPGVQDWVLDLVRREAACCPFLSYQVDAEDDQIVCTITGLGAADVAVLDDFLGDSLDGDGPCQESSDSIAQRLTNLGGVRVIAPTET
jgi:hypothetical protein